MPIPTKRGITEKPFSTFPVQIELEHTREGFLFSHTQYIIRIMYVYMCDYRDLTTSAQRWQSVGCSLS